MVLPGTVYSGASPRGRRNRPGQHALDERARCISAWAEEPRRPCASPPCLRVHLRVGGGTAGARELRSGPRVHLRVGGEPSPCRRHASRCRVHLRVGGGTPGRCGTASSATGASPRGRRNPGRVADDAHDLGCISAWAEEPSAGAAARGRCAVHLRVGGGTPKMRPLFDGMSGASPRGRRNRRRGPAPCLFGGCISAWAEEPPVRAARRDARGVHLRVGGGTPIVGTPDVIGRGASPHGRRNRVAAADRPADGGCISAWAEEPSRRGAVSGTRGVHLRVGGGTAVDRGAVRAEHGASPRGRRNRHRETSRPSAEGCISAWAEEPRVGQ